MEAAKTTTPEKEFSKEKLKHIERVITEKKRLRIMIKKYKQILEEERKKFAKISNKYDKEIRKGQDKNMNKAFTNKNSRLSKKVDKLWSKINDLEDKLRELNRDYPNVE